MRECSGFFGNNTKKFEKEERSFLKANPTLLLDFFALLIIWGNNECK